MAGWLTGTIQAHVVCVSVASEIELRHALLAQELGLWDTLNPEFGRLALSASTRCSHTRTVALGQQRARTDFPIRPAAD